MLLSDPLIKTIPWADLPSYQSAVQTSQIEDGPEAAMIFGDAKVASVKT